MALAIPAHAQTILRLLTVAAESGERCPTNDTLSEAVHAKSSHVATNAIALLECIGLITVVRGSCSRMVTICATGKSTTPVVAKVRVYGTGTRPPPPHNRKVRPVEYVEPVRVDPALIVDRDPCGMCGTRRDIGCAHTRMAA